MALHTYSDSVLVQTGFAPAAFTNGTQNGTGVDLAQNGGTRRAAAVINLNTGAATTGNYVLQDSPDNSTWTNVTGGTLGSAQAASLNNVYVLNIDCAKRQRYLRVQIVGTGTAGSASATFHLFEQSNLAPTNANVQSV